MYLTPEQFNKIVEIYQMCDILNDCYTCETVEHCKAQYDWWESKVKGSENIYHADNKWTNSTPYEPSEYYYINIKRLLNR